MAIVFLRIWLHETVIWPPAQMNLASADQRDVATLVRKSHANCELRNANEVEMGLEESLNKLFLGAIDSTDT